MAKVLIAEDEETVRLILSRMLAHIGGDKFEVETVASGAEALERLMRNGIDVFITDLAMPGMSGLEAIERVREFSPVPIVVVSGRDWAEQAIAAGANRFFAKPPDFYKLAAAVMHLAAAKVRRPSSGEVMELNRRLAKLKEQAARHGIDTPPNVLLEIEDIELKLAQ
jgi:CheY-like chemotaxis protein